MSATTPYRANVAAHQSSYQTPSRRALGELTPRAINSPSTHSGDSESSQAIQARSQLKKVTSHIPSVFADKENLLASVSSHGKKRSIDEVDDVEKAGGAKMLAHGRDASLWESGMRLTTQAMQQHTENNPVGLADPGSPTERNTPTPEPEPIQTSQKSNASFSDFLNYELCASQKSEHAGEAVPSSAPKGAPTTPPQSTPRSRAEILRTRLKFGLYKVKTHQEDKKGMDIISSFEASSSPPSPMGVPNITISSPRRDMPVFVKANLDPFRPIGKLGQPPVQFAIPGVAPSATTYAPPLGEENDDGDVPETAHQKLQRMKEESFRASSLTSSAVTDNAAAGLLELSTERR
ncbi:hypothetical protein IQ06DRAFT_251807 [Phaeosphaeriaceae sp. SRC1lsM3a]|nr:hypothetical protein IQ06DRAFT_251807 [Stagonospora sp. SRC1lsM3a]